jgi:hypothetical protein
MSIFTLTKVCCRTATRELALLHRSRFTQLLIACFIVAAFGLPASAQTRTVSGKVLTATDNVPLEGVSVMIKGTRLGTLTDTAGNFSIQASPGQRLVVTYAGYQEGEVLLKSR